MNSFDFLKTELEVLAKDFPNVNIRYGFNNKIEAHIVELLPLNEYNTNKKLDESWIQLSLKFNETFITEEVVFISSDSTLSLTDVIFEYNNLAACSENEAMSDLFVLFSGQTIDYTFDTSFTNGKVISAKVGDLIIDQPNGSLDPENCDSYTYSIAA